MAHPEATPTAAADAPATKKYSGALRIWHWGNAAVIAGLLSTILFLKVIINMRGLLPKVQERLHEQGVEASKEQLRGIGGLVSHRIWDWHIYLGVTLAVLLGWRLVAELAAPTLQRFAHRLRRSKEHQQDAPAESFRLRHSVLVKYSYLLFYLMLTVMVVTGLILVYADDVEALHKIEHTVKEIHNVNMYLIIAFIVAHLGGVVWAELNKDKNITSDMIHGGEIRK
ncbi:cytochrome b/b6 domain-containing protein [Hymenobacter jeollabukensis]|uniref:Cytochrome b/b6 domain-containing protein n=1 Tax=Hymenobacter jeollabukensis TaxID=2025313 RepID=A0A5R8WR97_9BACT|nr:cytochrome b/b6 domain-containing protein [Hymenobacter jeollabukensis]TLM93050.1 cytochrome b/b6 domain-containing protein [Hymenobacter jeollabukensis]